MDNNFNQGDQLMPSKQSVNRRSKNNQTRHVSLHDKVFKKVHRQLKRANKKEFGKPITISEIVNLGMDSITDKGIEELQGQSLRSKDKLEISYREHCQRSGKIPKAEFIEKLMNTWASYQQNREVGDLVSSDSFIDQNGEE